MLVQVLDAQGEPHWVTWQGQDQIDDFSGTLGAGAVGPDAVPQVIAPANAGPPPAGRAGWLFQNTSANPMLLVEIVVDPPSRNWWEACTLGPFELTRLEAVPRSGGPAVAAATFRNMDLLPNAPRPRVLGLIDVWVEESFRRRGLAIFLLGEAFRHFHREGITTVEVQAMQHSVAALGLYQKLGFQQVAHGSVLRKET